MSTKKYEIKDFLEVKSAGSPSLSPDGTTVSFLGNATGTNQIYTVSSQGGDPVQVTSYDDSVAFAVFSPVKNEILFGKDEKGDEQVQLYLYSLDTKETRSLTGKPSVKHNFGQFSRDGKHISYSQNERNGKDFDIYVMDLETDETECVYDQGGACFAGSFSPARTHLVIRRRISLVSTDVLLYSFTEKKIEPIAEYEEAVNFAASAWLPDSSGFYTITDKDSDFMRLVRYDLATKELVPALSPAWDIDSVTISHDGTKLAVIVNEDGYNKLELYDAQSLEPIAMTGLPEKCMIYGARFSKDSRFMALSIGSSTRATDVWMYSIEEGTCWQITHSAQGVPSDVLVEPELLRFKSFDGLEVPAFLYMPKDVAAGSKVPVIFNIHGGPEGQWQPSLALPTQYFVYQGYAVIAPNVRGSTGYGKKYVSLDDVEKRMDSVRDMASLHEHIKTMPGLDSSKVALMGGSYGGFMVLAGLTFYPDLWVGGVDIVGISNFVTFLENTAAWRRGLREAEYGSLEKDRDFLISISPINHVDKIKAPLLMIHGANDPRVPLNEAEQMAEKLAALGQTAGLLVYHDEGHGLSKLKNRLDAYPKVTKFLEQIFA